MAASSVTEGEIRDFRTRLHGDTGLLGNLKLPPALSALDALAASMTALGPTLPAPPIDPIFSPVIHFGLLAPYQASQQTGGFGMPSVDHPQNYRLFGFCNTFAGGRLTKITLRSWKFRPVAGRKVVFLKGNTGASTFAVSISEHPGQFLGLSSRATGNTGSVAYSTRPGDAATAVILDPAKDYYFNVGYFLLAKLKSDGVFEVSPNETITSGARDFLYQIESKPQP